MKMDLHTHYYPPRYFEAIRETPSDFSFGTDPTGRTIIRHRGARFFGVTPPMTDPARRLEDMDRAGIDVEVISLSTPNVFFADASRQPEVARMVNDAYAELIALHPKRFRGFASIPMDAPDAALVELHRAVGELNLQGVILLSNIRGRALTDPDYRPFFDEANRLGLCIFLHPMLPAHSEPFNEYVLGPSSGFRSTRPLPSLGCALTGCSETGRISGGSSGTWAGRSRTLWRGSTMGSATLRSAGRKSTSCRAST